MNKSLILVCLLYTSCAVLFVTVLFANFAESVAEGRGKAQAASLKKTQKDTAAHLLLSLIHIWMLYEEVFKKIYGRLSPLYQRINEIYGARAKPEL